MNVATKGKTKPRINRRALKRNLFFAGIVALPVLQFCICYIYINFNSFILAFQEYTDLSVTGGAGYAIDFAGFENFKRRLAIFPVDFICLRIRFYCFSLRRLSV